MEEFFKIGQAAKLLGVHPDTLRKATNDGKISCNTTPGGQRVYTRKQLLQLNPNLFGSSNKGKVIHYVRVSNGDKTLLKTQVKTLSENGEPDYLITDKASGLNEKRKGLSRVIQLVKTGDISEVHVTHKDRLTRFGFRYLEELFNSFGVTIVVVGDKTVKSPQEELLQDFISLLASFSGKYYKFRGLQQRKDFLEKTGGLLDE